MCLCYERKFEQETRKLKGSTAKDDIYTREACIARETEQRHQRAARQQGAVRGWGAMGEAARRSGDDKRPWARCGSSAHKSASSFGRTQSSAIDHRLHRPQAAPRRPRTARVELDGPWRRAGRGTGWCARVAVRSSRRRSPHASRRSTSTVTVRRQQGGGGLGVSSRPQADGGRSCEDDEEQPEDNRPLSRGVSGGRR